MNFKGKKIKIKFFFPKFCRNGKVVKIIKIPAEVVTAVEWGGKNFDKLFVCTASKAFDVLTGQIAQRTFSRESGKVFVVTGLGVTGVPQNTLDI